MRPLVLFDYDGVLVDSLDYFLDAFLDSCLENGFERVKTREDFLALFDVNFYEGMARAGLDGKLRDDVFHGMARRLAGKSTRYTFFPGIPDALRRLAAFADIVVVTSNDSAVVQAYLDEHDLTLYKDVLGGDKDTSKVRKIRSMARLYPGAPLVYVGDTTGDILEAREGGALAVGAAWGWHGATRLAGAKPDRLLMAPAELPGCITQISRLPGAPAA